jgi:hypothetical protein
MNAPGRRLEPPKVGMDAHLTQIDATSSRNEIHKSATITRSLHLRASAPLR